MGEIFLEEVKLDYLLPCRHDTVLRERIEKQQFKSLKRLVPSFDLTKMIRCYSSMHLYVKIAAIDITLMLMKALTFLFMYRIITDTKIESMVVIDCHAVECQSRQQCTFQH
jgi:hypothetical protein